MEVNLMERRLGRGLGALLGDSPQLGEGSPSRDLPIQAIRPNPHQPRKTFEETSLRELADSLKRHGFLQPVVVRPVASGYELIAGERRWRAAKLAGLESIPALVRNDLTEAQMLELALVENVQREDLDAIERALGFRAMIDSLGLTQEEVAKKVGLQRATVSNQLRLLELPAEVQTALTKGLISMGHARAMLALGSRELQLAVLARIGREGLSVRQVEGMTRSAGGAEVRARSGGATLVPRKAWVSELEDRIRTRLGTKVTIRNGTGYRGQIVIEYFDRAALERVCELICPAERLE
ncbi:MAG: ParB/RepB/Spo0J family partition protein [Planctomycetota bacterium]